MSHIDPYEDDYDPEYEQFEWEEAEREREEQLKQGQPPMTQQLTPEQLQAQIAQLQALQAAQAQMQAQAPQHYQQPAAQPNGQAGCPLPKASGMHPVIRGAFQGQLIDFKAFQGKNHRDPNVEQTKIRIIFRIPEKDTEVSKVCNYVLSPKATLRAEVKLLSGGDCPDAVFRDEQTLWAHVSTLFGRWYTIVCQPSDDGQYTNIVGLVPAQQAQAQPHIFPPSQMPPQQQPAPHVPVPQGADHRVSYDDDDIPF